MPNFKILDLGPIGFESEFLRKTLFYARNFLLNELEARNFCKTIGPRTLFDINFSRFWKKKNEERMKEKEVLIDSQPDELVATHNYKYDFRISISSLNPSLFCFWLINTTPFFKLVVNKMNETSESRRFSNSGIICLKAESH